MPWHIETNYSGCAGYAVVKDSTGEIEACHATRVDAKKHIAALYIAEPGARAIDRAGVIVDIDGTLVANDGTPRPTVIEYVKSLNKPIFIVSGRNITARVATKELIDSLGLDYEAIYLNDRNSTLAHKKATASRLIGMYGIDAAIENDTTTRAIYAELGIAEVINPNEIGRRTRLEYALNIMRRLLP
jgi:hypothetical protein